MAAGKKINITKTDEDNEVYEFEIQYEDKLILINCIMEITDAVLYMRKVDIEGAEANAFGNKLHLVIKEIAHEFCRIYKCDRIEITGAKRTAGLTKGSYLRTIKHQFDSKPKKEK